MTSISKHILFCTGKCFTIFQSMVGTKIDFVNMSQKYYLQKCAPFKNKLLFYSSQRYSTNLHEFLINPFSAVCP